MNKIEPIRLLTQFFWGKIIFRPINLTHTIIFIRAQITFAGLGLNQEKLLPEL